MLSIPSTQIFDAVIRHGFNASSFQVLASGYLYFRDEKGGLIAYVDTGQAYVVAGSPFSHLNHISFSTRQFEEFAKKQKRRICYFAVEKRFLEHYPGKAICVGEQPVFSPRAWSFHGRKPVGIRKQIKRPLGKGVIVRHVNASQLSSPLARVRLQIEDLITAWKKSRKIGSLTFLVDLQPFLNLNKRLYFTAEQAGRVVAFLVASPIYAREGWLIEHFIRDPKAPNGTVEMLIDAAICKTAEYGAAYLTLGMAPLSQAAFWPLRVQKTWLNSFYNFDGLYRFKAKFQPHRWDRLFLAYPAMQQWPSALYDTLSAFAGGHPFRFAWQSLGHAFSKYPRPAAN